MGFPIQPLVFPTYTPVAAADVIAALKTIAGRNQLISRTSINLGFENNAGTLFASNLNSSYATATAVSGSLPYPQTLRFQSHWTTLLTLNEGQSPGQTSVNVNSGAYTAIDESVLYNKTSNTDGTMFKLCLFQAPINFANLTSVAATFNKASSTSQRNSQLLIVLPGKWSAIAQDYRVTSSYSPVAVQQNDLVFIKGGLDRADNGIPTILHGALANTRIEETYSTYGSSAGQIALNAMDAAGTFQSNCGSLTVSSGGGGHTGGGGSIIYYYSTFSQSLRFIQP